MRKTLKIIGGILTVLAIASVGANMAGVLKPTPTYWLQVIGAFLGGPALFGASYINFSKFKLPTTALVQGRTDVQMDQDAIYHLAGRSKNLGDKTALELCRQLQDRFFGLHYKATELDNEKDTSGNTLS